jgi:hypothetical protein
MCCWIPSSSDSLLCFAANLLGCGAAGASELLLRQSERKSEIRTISTVVMFPRDFVALFSLHGKTSGSVHRTANYEWWNFFFFFLIRIVWGGVQAGATRHVGHWMAYCTVPGWLWWWRIWWNEDWQGKPKYSEKTCPNAIMSTTNPTWPDPGSSPGRRGGKPATNCLSYGAATSSEPIRSGAAVL